MLQTELAIFCESLNKDVKALDYQWVSMNAGKQQGAQKSDIIQSVKKVVGKADCVGSFNSFGTKLWGSFLVKRNEVNFSKIEKDYMGFVSFVELDPDNDEV